VDSLWLHVGKTKPGAVKLYLSEGFKPAPASPMPTFKSVTGELLMKLPVQGQTLCSRMHVSQRNSSSTVPGGQQPGPAPRGMPAGGSESSPGARKGSYGWNVGDLGEDGLKPEQ
jgi:hypothetical protein